MRLLMLTSVNGSPSAGRFQLARIGDALGDDAMLIVSVDSTIDASILIPARHDGDSDGDGLIAALHRNLLERINRELDGDFEPSAFRHEARFDAERQRVETHLVSRTWETFEVMGRRFGFPAGDSIRTECSYKYSLTRFQRLAERAGWSPMQFWSDAHSRVGVHVLQRQPGRVGVARAERFALDAAPGPCASTGSAARPGVAATWARDRLARLAKCGALRSLRSGFQLPAGGHV